MAAALNYGPDPVFGVPAIVIDPSMIPGAAPYNGENRSLTVTQLATVLGHELIHATIQQSHNSYAAAANPNAAVAVGETNELIAYVSQYVISLQLNDTSMLKTTLEGKALLKALNAFAKGESFDAAAAATITTTELLQSSAFYLAALNSGSDLVSDISKLRISSNEDMTYTFLWQDAWVMRQYGFRGYNPSKDPIPGATAPQLGYSLAYWSGGSIKVVPTANGWTFSATNIQVNLNAFSLPTGGTRLPRDTPPSSVTSATAKLTILGSETGNTVDLGTYSIYVAKTSSSSLAETLFYSTGSQNVTLTVNGGYNWFYLPKQWSGIVTINPSPFLNKTDLGGIEVGANLLGGSGSTQIGGSASALMERTGANSWSGSDGLGGTCVFTLASDNTLTISDDAWQGGTIVIKNFNLSAAESTNGFLGIFLEEKFGTITISPVDGATSSSQNQQPSVHADDATTPPEPDFVAGTSESCTVSLDALTESPQTITLTLSGAPASDFAVDTGSGLTSLSSAGTFTVTVAAGEASASFLLENIADVGGDATLQLGESMPDEADPSDTITGGTVTQSYVEPTDDPFTQPTSALLSDLGPDTSPGAGNIELYSYAPSTISGGVSAGNGNNYIDITDAINQSFSGGTGNDTINATFGEETSTGDVDGGTDVINGNGGSDIISLPAVSSSYPGGQVDTPPSAAVSVFADSSVNLATAIADANGGGGQREFMET